MNQGMAFPAENELNGVVTAVSGSRASIGLPQSSSDLTGDNCATVGRCLRIQRGSTALIGMIVDVSLETSAVTREQGYHVTAHVDMMGEIRPDGEGTRRFRRGITHYPVIGDQATPGRRGGTAPGLCRLGRQQDRASATCTTTPRSKPLSISTTCSPSTSPSSARPASASRARCRCCSARSSRCAPTCASSCSMRTTNTAAASAIAPWCSTRAT